MLIKHKAKANPSRVYDAHNLCRKLKRKIINGTEIASLMMLIVINAAVMVFLHKFYRIKSVYFSASIFGV